MLLRNFLTNTMHHTHFCLVAISTSRLDRQTDRQIAHLAKIWKWENCTPNTSTATRDVAQVGPNDKKPPKIIYQKIRQIVRCKQDFDEFLSIKHMQSPETEIYIGKSAEIGLKKIVKLSELIFGGFW